jgi:aminopeptidase-like protein
MTQDDRMVGSETHALMAELFPLCRSLAGDGTRDLVSFADLYQGPVGEFINTAARLVEAGLPQGAVP